MRVRDDDGVNVYLLFRRVCVRLLDEIVATLLSLLRTQLAV